MNRTLHFCQLCRELGARSPTSGRKKKSGDGGNPLMNQMILPSVPRTYRKVMKIFLALLEKFWYR